METTLETPLGGVLILKGNKTFGRRNGKLLYKCITFNFIIAPLNYVLLPYAPRTQFSKSHTNLYVAFGKLLQNSSSLYFITEVFGEVSDDIAYANYMLHINNLRISRKCLDNVANAALKEKEKEKELKEPQFNQTKLDLRSHVHVFSIDPIGSRDFDDAFSMDTSLDNSTTFIYIHIANVPSVIDDLNLWESLTDQVSTIYLPHGNKPMLPRVLSDNHCSLLEGHVRNAFTMQISVNSENGAIITTRIIGPTLIHVARNYTYEDPQLLADIKYNALFSICQKMQQHFLTEHSVTDSHTVVSYLMITMNYYMAKSPACPIMRIHRLQNQSDKMDKSNKSNKSDAASAAEYIVRSNDFDCRHDALLLDMYSHTTSPIRRLSDIITLTSMQLVANSSSIRNVAAATAFVDKWLHQLEFVNDQMTRIKRVQSKCMALHICRSHANIQQWDGIIQEIRDNNYIFYIPSLKLFTRIPIMVALSGHTLLVGDKLSGLQMFLFEDENTLESKVRFTCPAIQNERVHLEPPLIFSSTDHDIDASTR